MNPANLPDRPHLPSLPFEYFAHVSIVVSDLARAKSFYGGLLGLRELPRPNFSFPGAWYSLAGGQSGLKSENPGGNPEGNSGGNPGKGVELHIIVKEDWLKPPVRPEPFNVRYPHLALWVSDADATYEELLKRRDRVETVLTGTGYRQVYIFDDDHNLVEFMGPTKSKKG